MKAGPDRERMIFRSAKSEAIVVLALAGIAMLCSFLLWKGWELSQRTERLAKTAAAESEARTAANRGILRILCGRQNYTYRILRADARGDIRQAKAFLRGNRKIPGITDKDLRRAIRRNREFIHDLKPLNCKTFAGSLPTDLMVPTDEEFLVPLSREIQELQKDVNQLGRKIDRAIGVRGIRASGKGDAGGG